MKPNISFSMVVKITFPCGNNFHRKKCCKDNSCLFHCNIVNVLGNSLIPNIFTMNKIQQNCTIPNSCNLSCKMNNCISVGFFKSSIVQLLWKCCIKGANDQVEVQTTCSIVYLMGYWNTTVLKLFHWLEKQWELGFTILVIGRFFPVLIPWW